MTPEKLERRAYIGKRIEDALCHKWSGVVILVTYFAVLAVLVVLVRWWIATR